MKLPLLLGIYATGIPFFIAIYNTFKLLNFIEKDAAFTMNATNCLDVITKCAISEIALYFGGIVYLDVNDAMQPDIVLLGLVIIFVAFIIGIFAEILKELLIKVVEIKNENELTI